MNKICTTIEQSKKLIELGLDRKTSDMYYWCGGGLRIGGHRAQNEGLDIPAWSLTALLDILYYEVVDGEGESYYLKIDKDDIGYQIRYEDRWNSEIETKWYDDPLDAAFEMICWLLESHYI